MVSVVGTTATSSPWAATASAMAVTSGPVMGSGISSVRLAPNSFSAQSSSIIRCAIMLPPTGSMFHSATKNAGRLSRITSPVHGAPPKRPSTDSKEARAGN